MGIKKSWGELKMLIVGQVQSIEEAKEIEGIYNLFVLSLRIQKIVKGSVNK